MATNNKETLYAAPHGCKQSPRNNVNLNIGSCSHPTEKDTGLVVSVHYHHKNCFMGILGSGINIPTKKLSSALQLACTTNDTDLVKILLDHKADANVQDKKGRTVLLQACLNGRTELAKLLVLHNADHEIGDEKGLTPLKGAVANNHQECVALLLTRYKMQGTKTYQGSLVQAVMFAFQAGQIKCIKSLLEKHDADPNMRVDSRTEDTILIHSVKNNREGVVKMLLSEGAIPDVQNHLGDTALIQAVKDDRFQFVKILLSNGLDRNIRNKQGDTALIQAVKNKNVRMVRELISNLTHINLQNKLGDTAIIQAVKDNNLDIVKVLVKAGANVVLQNKLGDSALIQAVKNNPSDASMVRELVNPNSASINLKNKQGDTALIITVRDDSNVELLNVLLACKPNVNIRNRLGHSALTSCICCPKTSERYISAVVIKLLRAGADPNNQTVDGVSALMFAADLGHAAVTQNILTCRTKGSRTPGANLELRDSNGDTALLYAVNANNERGAQVLLQAGANVNAMNNERESPVILSQHIVMLDLLIQYNANVEVKDKYGRTALTLACYNGEVDIIQLLINKGASVNHILRHHDGVRTCVIDHAVQFMFSSIDFYQDHSVDTCRCGSDETSSSQESDTNDPVTIQASSSGVPVGAQGPSPRVSVGVQESSHGVSLAHVQVPAPRNADRVKVPAPEQHASTQAPSSMSPVCTNIPDSMKAACAPVSATGQCVEAKVSVPGQGVAAQALAPRQGVAAQALAPRQGVAAQVSAPGQGVAAQALAPGQGVAAQALAPRHGVAAKVSTPGKGAVAQALAPGQGIAAQVSAPGQGVAAQVSTPGHCVTAQASTPGQLQATGDSTPSDEQLRANLMQARMTTFKMLEILINAGAPIDKMTRNTVVNLWKLGEGDLFAMLMRAKSAKDHQDSMMNQ